MRLKRTGARSTHSLGSLTSYISRRLVVSSLFLRLASCFASHFVFSYPLPLHVPFLPRSSVSPSFSSSIPPPWRDAPLLPPSWHRLPPSWRLLRRLLQAQSHVLSSGTSSSAAIPSQQQYVPPPIPSPFQHLLTLLPADRICMSNLRPLRRGHRHCDCQELPEAQRVSLDAR